MQISKLVPIGVLVASIVGGIIFFYLSSNLSKENKKVHIEQMISELVNFIVFIWVGKIVLNISLFVQDPLAIFAYPSDSRSFYIAVLCSSVSLFLKAKKGKINVVSLSKSFLPVFLVGSFLYEFIYIVFLSKGGPNGYFILITIVLLLFLLLNGRLSTKLLFVMILAGWCFGILFLTFIQPFVTVFGYIMAPWFVGLFFIVNFFIIFRKRDF
ncbi:hypothetical protein [Bacillus sp. SD088]|uniref:hypothetical protein n=1 Tax=Bacillus sp. SD088 TaxID=2782012 RepID=UPI0028BDA8A2|nr:hypothetical protein [Bacillus sp. SD088]